MHDGKKKRKEKRVQLLVTDPVRGGRNALRALLARTVQHTVVPFRYAKQWLMFAV